MADVSKAVLITGCSTGIGRATAVRLAKGGHAVYASARKLDAIADLEPLGCKLLELDVCDEVSMSAAVAVVEQAHGAVGVLVNNAGYSQAGAVESITPESLQRQFQTNVLGLVRMAQLVLPAMRAQHFGKIINISSIAGKMVFPGAGAYHATKFAVEALSDALRFEVKGFGVDVTLIEPGFIRTSFSDTLETAVADGAAPEGPYAHFNRAVVKATKGVYSGPLKLIGGNADSCAKAIEKVIASDHAPRRVPVTPSAHMMLAARRLTPDALWEAAMGMQFPRPRPS